MKKILLLTVISIILVGCTGEVIEGFPDDKKVETNVYRNLLLDDDKFSSYVDEVEFDGRPEDWGVSQGYRRTAYFLDINVESNEVFESLSYDEKFYLLKSMIKKLKEEDNFSYTGKWDIYKFGQIALLTQENSYSMQFFDEWDEHKYSLVINDGEVYRTEEEQIAFLKDQEEIEVENKEKKIYRYMQQVYADITNNGADYIPELHDPKVDKMVSEEFGISESEANRIYLKYNLDD